MWFEVVSSAASSFDMEVKVANGPWRSSSRTRFRHGKAIAGRPFVFTPRHAPVKKGGTVSVPLRLTPVGVPGVSIGPMQDERILAFDKHHNKVEIHGIVSGGDEPTELMVNNPDSVALVVVQNRPFQIVRFRNIRTHPR